jgi:hypothetical protein
MNVHRKHRQGKFWAPQGQELEHISRADTGRNSIDRDGTTWSNMFWRNEFTNNPNNCFCVGDSAHQHVPAFFINQVR